MELSSKDVEVNEVIADFEIVDYTCASPWEKFIASLEDVFRGWMVQIHQDEKKFAEEGSDSDIEANSFVESTKVVTNEQQKYQLTMYRANRRASPTSTTGYLDDTINSMMDWNLDFPSHAHHLQRWFGITTFITVSRFQSDLEINPSEASMLLSSIQIAISNILTSYNFTSMDNSIPEDADKVPEFNIPIFIPIHERWKGTYIGTHKIDNLSFVTSKSHHSNRAHNAEAVAVVADMGIGVDIRFESDVSTSPPSSITHNNINGLLDLYESTLGHVTYENRNEYNNEGRQMINVAARFTYMKTLDDYWSDTTDDQDEKEQMEIDNNKNNNNEPKYNYSDVMSKQDTIMMASTRDAYSDITSEFSLFPFDDPLEALHLGVTWYCDSLEHLYNEDQFDVHDAPQWLLRVIYSKKPLTMISESVETLTKAITVSQGLDTVSQIVNIGQTNVVPPQPLFEAVSSISTISRSINELPSAEEIDMMLKQLLHPKSAQIPLVADLAPYELKAAPPRSLLSFLSINLLNARGLRGMALLWWEFVKELRWYWDNTVLVPRVFTSETITSTPKPEDANRIDSIDLKYSLIFQKLQMLNHCIEHKQHYNKVKSSTSQEDPFHQKPSDGSSGWDDFDVDISDEETSTTQKQIKFTDDGSIGQLEGLVSLKTGAPLLKPKTQVFGLMTEDMIAEQVEIFSKLGTSEDAMKIRARLQSASLLSDMQAFKACNPGCCLEDFIRWHSPNDWVDGHLSARMEAPGNLWKQMWEEATPIPVSHQAPIFDYITIAEKILHYLETITPSELLKQVLRVALGTIFNHFSHSSFSKIPAIQQRISSLGELLKQFSENSDSYPNIFEAISSIEILLNKAKSLQKRFPNTELLTELLLNGEVPVSEPVRPSILSLFVDKYGKLPHPDAREFILRSILKPSNLPTTKRIGNRLYILLTSSEFRLATVQMQLANS